MPMRKNISYKRRKPSSSRKSNRRNNFISTKLQVFRVPGKTVMPNILKTQFRFNSRLTLDYNATTGVSSQLSLIGNSLFDPLGSSGTAQPPLFDQLMVFYQSYYVTGCAIKITFTNTQDAALVVYCTPVTDITDTYSTATGTMMPGAVSKVLGPLNGSSSTVVVNNYASTKRIKGNANTDDLRGGAGVSPAELWYWHISSAPVFNGYTVDISIALWVELTFYAVLSECQVVNNS